MPNEYKSLEWSMIPSQRGMNLHVYMVTSHTHNLPSSFCRNVWLVVVPVCYSSTGSSCKEHKHVFVFEEFVVSSGKGVSFTLYVTCACICDYIWLYMYAFNFVGTSRKLEISSASNHSLRRTELPTESKRLCLCLFDFWPRPGHGVPGILAVYHLPCGKLT